MHSHSNLCRLNAIKHQLGRGNYMKYVYTALTCKNLIIIHYIYNQTLYISLVYTADYSVGSSLHVVHTTSERNRSHDVYALSRSSFFFCSKLSIADIWTRVIFLRHQRSTLWFSKALYQRCCFAVLYRMNHRT